MGLGLIIGLWVSDWGFKGFWGFRIGALGVEVWGCGVSGFRVSGFRGFRPLEVFSACSCRVQSLRA